MSIGVFFAVATLMLQMDISRNSRNGIGLGLRNVLAASGLFILSTASQTVATIYRESIYYLDTLAALLIVGLIAIVVMAIMMAQLIRAMVKEK